MSKRERHRTRSDDAQQRPDDGAEEWRLFVAIPLPIEVKAFLGSIEAAASIAALPLRFVAPDLAHITLHFLGATPPEQAELISLSLQQTLRNQRAAQLSTAELGVFPGIRKPRVLWLGLTGETQILDTIHSITGDTLRRLGIEVEKRALRPHITLGRLRSEQTGNAGERFQQAIDSSEVRSILAQGPVAFQAREIHLMRSHLEKLGPRYEVIRVFSLAAP